MTAQDAETLFAIRREHEGRLVRVDLNRPDEGNAMTSEMTVALTGLLRGLGADTGVHAVAIEGRGAHFCRGREVKRGDRAGMSAYQVRERVMSVVLDAYEAIAGCPVPVVACVHGPAAGFGAALSMACDITLATENARFSFPEIHHQIPPALAMSTLIGKVAPKAIAYLIYSGREIEAKEALSFGMVSQLLPAATFAGEVDRFLAELADRPRVVLQTIKRYQRNARQLPADMLSEYAGVLLSLAQTEVKRT
jgi:enoyl-CoA hydratase/carnithine racemase